MTVNKYDTDYINGVIPPHDTELERAVLAALIAEPRQIPTVIKILQPEAFYSPKHEAIYRAITDLYDDDKPVDLIAVGQQLTKAGVMPGRITPAELSDLVLNAGSASNVEVHARFVVEKWVGRLMLETGREMTARAADPRADVADVIGYAGSQLERVGAIFTGGRAGFHIRDCVASALKDAEQRAAHASEGRTPGITTGLTDLDRATGGWQGGQLIILAARPAMGKTALMLHFALSAARAGMPVCIYSLEMARERLADRLLLSVVDVDSYAYRSGRLTSDEWRKIEGAAGQLSRLPVYVDDNPAVTMRYIRADSRVRASQGQCGMLLIDYLQLAGIDDKSNRTRNREQEVAQMSRQAKIIAKELNVPVILLSQLSRNAESRGDSIPRLSDLRESGAIEQDADIVAAIYRPAYYGQKEMPGMPGVSSDGAGVIRILKQRDGALGDIPFRHNPAMTRITDFDDPSTCPASTAPTPF